MLSPFDRLVGEVDAAADRRAGTFTVAAVHEDVPFTPAMTDAVDLATWQGLTLDRTLHQTLDRPLSRRGRPRGRAGSATPGSSGR